MSFPRYPEYKDSGVEWVGPVPGHWTVCATGHRLAYPPCYGVLVPDFDPNGVPMLKIMDLADGVPDIGALTTISEKLSNEYQRTLVRCGDVVLSVVGTIGSVLVVPESLEGINLSRALARLIPDDALSPHWLKWIFSSDNFTRFVDLVCVGTAQRVLNMDDLRAFRAPFPPLDEQAIISSFLDRETAKIDALVAEQEQLITLLKEKRQAVISHAVTKGLDPSVPMKDSGVEWLGKIPAHWEVKRIKDCGCEVVDCKNRTPEPHIDGEYFVVRTSCVKDGEFNPEPGYWTDEENFIEWTAKGRPQVGDVLFTREAPTGEACLAPDGLDFCLGQRMMYIRPPKKALLSEFLLYSIYGGLARERINEKSKGSTVGHLRVGEVGELPLLLPPMEEQQALVEFVGEELSKLSALAVQAEEAIALMTERRSALISAAVTGQIDVRGLAPAQEQAA